MYILDSETASLPFCRKDSKLRVKVEVSKIGRVKMKEIAANREKRHREIGGFMSMMSNRLKVQDLAKRL